MSMVVRTLSERVFEIVRERIVTGALAEDLPIRQDALASQLGVSKIPLREALARLEQEGLLFARANRGYFVQPMSSAQVEEIFALRLAIEPAASAFAAGCASSEERGDARRAYDAFASAADENRAEIAIRNREFHTALVRPGARLITTQLVERLAVLAERYVVAHVEPSGRHARSQDEHRALFEAWMARDAAGVRARLAEHLESTLVDLRLQLASPAR